MASIRSDLGVTLTRETMLERSHARDAQFDGRFITGVLSTGIYCLPSCPARTPKPENVRFFADEASARAAGLRPCKRCRPDLFYEGRDPELELAQSIAALAARDPAAFADAKAFAAAFGVGVTRLNELVRCHFHDSPAAFLQRCRVERAQSLLLETDRPQLSVGADVGFDSTSAFHEAFKRRTGMSPGAYRRLRASGDFVVGLPAGFRRDDTLRTLARDPDSRSERRAGARLAKAIGLDDGGEGVVVDVELRSGAARCKVVADRAPGPLTMARCHDAVVRMLGLRTDVQGFERLAIREPRLRAAVAARAGLRVPLHADPFEALVWAIVGQQVNLRFACELRQTVIRLAGREVPGGLVAHPAPSAVAGLEYGDLTRRKFSRRKAEYLIDTARLCATGALDLIGLERGSAVGAERALRAVRGLGPWTAQYASMRGFGLADCVPVGDSGLAAALRACFELDERPDARRTAELMRPFAPHRSLATYHLWKTLGGPV